MSGSTIGNIFKVSTWGESHGEAVGVVVDGTPSGLSLCEGDIQKYLNRRKPGTSKYSTPRKEGDLVRILSGVFEGKTTGTPLSLMVENTNQKSKDYSKLADCYRPGHADYTYDAKYGFRDYRGGGRSSGRETIGRVAAGAVALKVLGELGVSVKAYTYSIGPYEIDRASLDLNKLDELYNNPLYMPDEKIRQSAEEYLSECIAKGDSAGGSIECVISGLPSGVGEPCFDKLNACLAKSIMSIGAVKAFEMGCGTRASKMYGSENNDTLSYDNGKLRKITNNSGGITGGISEGRNIDIYFRAHFKPTPSIGRKQASVNTNGENISLEIGGRHDPVIVPRAVVVVEAMAALTTLDLFFASMTSRMEHIRLFFSNIKK